MNEVIIGIGQHQTIPVVLEQAVLQLCKTQGVPRAVFARAKGFEIVASRPAFEGPFTALTLKFDAAYQDLDKVNQALAACGSHVTHSVEDLWHTITIDGGAASETNELLSQIDTLSQALLLPEVWRTHGDHYRVDPISVELLFQAMVQYKASDVHLAPGEKIVFRVDNQMRHADVLGVLSSAQIYALIREIAPERDWETFVNERQTSFNFHQVGIGYSRVSAFIKTGAPHCTIRFLPEVIPSFEELNIPREAMVRLGALHHGLVLITGMTGSGKSTSMAALVDWINTNKMVHILTIENPVEYVHVNKRAIISQRNTGTDVPTFADAVRGALRHDPDVIVIGEMRDPDTIRSAINAAATGHLVISTLHSNTAAEVVNRIVSFFDPVERDLVKLQLRDSLKAVICQRLIARTGGGRVPALEVMFNDIKPINSAILAGDTDGIRIGMQQTVSQSFIFEDYIMKLHKAGTIDLEHAREACTDLSIFDQMLMGTYSVPRLDSIKGQHMGGHH